MGDSDYSPYGYVSQPVHYTGNTTEREIGEGFARNEMDNGWQYQTPKRLQRSLTALIFSIFLLACIVGSYYMGWYQVAGVLSLIFLLAILDVKFNIVMWLSCCFTPLCLVFLVAGGIYTSFFMGK